MPQCSAASRIRRYSKKFLSRSTIVVNWRESQRPCFLATAPEPSSRVLKIGLCTKRGTVTFRKLCGRRNRSRRKSKLCRLNSPARNRRPIARRLWSLIGQRKVSIRTRSIYRNCLKFCAGSTCPLRARGFKRCWMRLRCLKQRKEILAAKQQWWPISILNPQAGTSINAQRQSSTASGRRCKPAS